MISAKTIKIFSQVGGKYCKNGNFGDNLTKFFLEKLLEYKVDILSKYSKLNFTQLTGIGSILHRVHLDYTGYIWTSGFGFACKNKTFSNAKVIAVRGKETLKRINCINKDKVILGDGGLLCYLFKNNTIKKKYKLGIIPHYIDKNNSIVKNIADKCKDIKIIDICGCENVMEDIQCCEYIISSSLHGLITADSFGIPNDWVKLSNNVGGNGFKFKDYYSVFDIENPEPIILNDNDTLTSIIKKILKQDYERKNIGIIAERLLCSLNEIIL